MRLPESLLSRLRAPLAAVALAGCAAPAVTVVPVVEPAPDVVAAPIPRDPVAYDAIAEAARLERADRELAGDLERRDDRIAAAERADVRVGIGSIGTSWSHQQMMNACGRG